MCNESDRNELREAVLALWLEQDQGVGVTSGVGNEWGTSGAKIYWLPYRLENYPFWFFFAKSQSNVTNGYLFFDTFD